MVQTSMGSLIFYAYCHGLWRGFAAVYRQEIRANAYDKSEARSSAVRRSITDSSVVETVAEITACLRR